MVFILELLCLIYIEIELSMKGKYILKVHLLKKSLTCNKKEFFSSYYSLYFHSMF